MGREKIHHAYYLAANYFAIFVMINNDPPRTGVQ